MKQVTYEEYLRHVGLGHYIHKHSYGIDSHTTELHGLNGIVAMIYRGNETKYFIY